MCSEENQHLRKGKDKQKYRNTIAMDRGKMGLLDNKQGKAGQAKQ